MEHTGNKIRKLHVKHFTAFTEAIFDFCPGINVLIGANSTGKTLSIKIIYTLLKICQTLRQRGHVTNIDIADIENAKLQSVFQLRNLSELIRAPQSEKGRKQRCMDILLEYADTQLDLKLEYTAEENGEGTTRMSPTYTLPSSITSAPPAVYLPAQEILSINPGFISIYQNRELPYDETYYDLSLALNALPLRHEKTLPEIRDILAFLRGIFTGEEHQEKSVVTLENDRFYFELPEGRFETHVVAEGYRKIATLLYLLKNGSLHPGSVLFWDEPEANLNPKLIVQLVEVLKKLAASGMQIFVTTHDYLLAHELSLLTEYQEDTKISMKFFALHKPSNTEGVEVESGRSLADIQHNPILDEFAAHYDRESAFFEKSIY